MRPLSQPGGNSGRRANRAFYKAGPLRPDEVDGATCKGTKLSGRSRHGAPDRKTQKMPLRPRRSFTRGTWRRHPHQ